MSEIRYKDFDLLVERLGDNEYRVRILSSPAGQATGEFSLPFSPLELENFLLKVGRTRRGVRRLESPEMDAAKVFGGKLFKAVFADELMGALRSSLDEVRKQRQGLRIRLRLNDAPELVNLPWEYLYNPSLNRFLSLSINTPIIRYLELPERIRPLPVTLPLRALAVISSPSDYPKLDVEHEWNNLKSALNDLEQRGVLVLDRLKTASPTELQSSLRRNKYHIFHFIGHGGFNEQAQDGILLFEDDSERGRPLSGQYLGTLLHDEDTLRLAVLNACEGARSGTSDPFAGVAQSLVQQGLPAVIAMQFEVTDEAAITFAREFYTAIADGYPVDASLAEARKAIFSLGNDIEWGTPVLYMRAPDGMIFDVSELPETGQAPLAETEVIPPGHPVLEDKQISAPSHAAALPQAETEIISQEETPELFQQAQQAMEASRWQEAYDFLSEVLAVEPDYPGGQRMLERVSDEIRAAKTLETGESERTARQSPVDLIRKRPIIIPIAILSLALLVWLFTLIPPGGKTPPQTSPTSLAVVPAQAATNTVTPTSTKPPIETPTSTPTESPTSTPTLIPTPPINLTSTGVCREIYPPADSCRYTISAGDLNFGRIAKKFYPDTDLKYSVYLINLNRTPEGALMSMQLGKTIFVPSLELLQTYPLAEIQKAIWTECEQGGTFPCWYALRRGDTLEIIANEYYGDPAKAKLIKDNNWVYDPSYEDGLVAGDELEKRIEAGQYEGMIIVLPRE